MDERQEQLRQECVYLCDRLLQELNRNKEDVRSFLGGDMARAYEKTTEAAINKTRRTKNKIRNL